MKNYQEHLENIINSILELELEDKISAINFIREKIHEVSPFKEEPVDLVRWVKSEMVISNDYNPNKVAPPEMQLLEVSIINDGYTQPIVSFPHDGVIEVVDGFHRSRVGKESVLVKQRVNGYLPIVEIRKEKQGKQERVASTIRHNRARGKHQVSAMSEIVIELKNRNWNNSRIAKELGMDEDEILRLCQISGLEGMFQDKDFSKAWVVDEDIENFAGIDDSITDEEMELINIPNEKDEQRIFHTFDKWESVKYGFYDTHHPKLSKLQCEYKYKELLSNPAEFAETLDFVFNEWINSCEHNLTNKSLNRIAWIGQAAVAYKYNVPSVFSSGWNLLDEKEKQQANKVALEYLNRWLLNHSINQVSLEEALQINRQVELY